MKPLKCIWLYSLNVEINFILQFYQDYYYDSSIDNQSKEEAHHLKKISMKSCSTQDLPLNIACWILIKFERQNNATFY